MSFKGKKSIIDDAVDEITKDQNDLYDFYAYCKRHNPAFKKLSIQQFKAWNDRRIQQTERKELYDQAAQDKVDPLDALANRIFLVVLMEGGGMADDHALACAVRLKNQLVSEQRESPRDDWAQHCMRELTEFCLPYFNPGVLSHMAEQELEKLREHLPKQIEV